LGAAGPRQAQGLSRSGRRAAGLARMNYLLPERLERLAREYALGTLAGPARRRFERVLHQTPAAVRAVGAWQERLGGLAATVPLMQPRDSVWRALEQRLLLRLGLRRAARCNGCGACCRCARSAAYWRARCCASRCCAFSRDSSAWSPRATCCPRATSAC